jgi:hypothetical protein
MPQLELVICPSSVRSGSRFAVHVRVDKSLDGESVQLELVRLDPVEGPWTATAVIAGTSGPAIFADVVLTAPGNATLKCRSTSHVVIPAAKPVRVDPRPIARRPPGGGRA